MKFRRLLISLAAVTLLCGCDKIPYSVKNLYWRAQYRLSVNKGESKNILVIHQLDEQYKGYPAFDKSLQREFARFKIDAKVRNIYLGMRSPDSGTTALQEGLGALEGWQPDLVIIERDWTLARVAGDSYGSALLDSGVPVLAVGIEQSDVVDRGSYPNLKIIHDEPDFISNIEIAYSQSRKSLVVVELDDNDNDNVLLGQLRNAIALSSPTVSSSRFVDNTDRSIPLSSLSEGFDKIMVMAVSAADPTADIDVSKYDSRSSFDQALLEYEKLLNSNSAYLCVKTDIFSDALAIASRSPQYTTRRESFYSGNQHYLCGYFANYETVAIDAASAGSQMLRGEMPSRVLHHEKHHYMDYSLMRACGMTYSVCAMDYTIEGAPVYLAHKGLLAILVAVSVLFLIIFYLLYRLLRYNKDKNTLADVSDKATTVDLALAGINAVMTRSKDEFVSSCGIIADESRQSFECLTNDGVWDMSGERHDEKSRVYQFSRKNRRIHSSIDGRSWHWWDVAVGRTQNDSGDSMLLYMMLNIDDIVSRENRLIQSRKLIEQSRRKESFLKSISHQMRTPLNSIVGFSEFLSTDSTLTEDERAEMCRYVKDNSDILFRIVNNILQYSRYESGRVTAHIETVRACDIFDDVLRNWSDKDVKISVFGARQDVWANVDKLKVVECFNQLIDNAVKFSSGKEIFVGWNYRYKDSRVVFYVEDQGSGLPEEFALAAPGTFWKADNYSTGAGLGLSLVQAYINLMKGHLVIDTCKGVGTKMKMVFDGCIKSE